MKRVSLYALILLTTSLAAGGNSADFISPQNQISKLGLSVYHSNFAVVTETRSISLPPGKHTLEFEGVAHTIQADSVVERSQNIEVLQQRYGGELLSPQTLLKKHLGREATLVFPGPPENPETPKRHRAKLLSLEKGQVWLIDGKVVANPSVMMIEYDSIPEGLSHRPKLHWELLAVEPVNSVEFSYLAGAIGWKADYIFLIQEEKEDGEVTGELASWATVTNRAGRSFKKAQLTLVAGEVNKEAPVENLEVRAMAAEAYAPEASSRANVHSTQDYYQFQFERPITLDADQQVQLQLLGAPKIKATRKYVSRSPSHYYRSKVLKPHSTSPMSYLEIKNSSENGLGIALPSGIVRVYEKTDPGANLFTGEGRISGVAVNERLSIATGRSFSLEVEKNQTAYQALGRNASKSSYEIEVRNRGERRATVELIEIFPGEWKLLETNIEPTSKEAFGALFSVTLNPGETKKLLYTAEVNFR